MGSFSLGRYIAFLLALLAVQGLLLTWNGLLMITTHEGDTMHVAQILLRMDMGQSPHIDFLTPIGIMAFAPIKLFLGLGLGKAFLAANIFMAALILPAVIWVAKSRLTGGLAYGFGAGVIFLMTAMMHGQTQPFTSISMYYNRWAWAVAFVIVLIAVVPTKIRRAQTIDGVILGLGFSFLALSKITFFVALLPAVAVAILMRKQLKTLAYTLGTGVVVVILVTLGAGGVAFWSGYLSDLVLVSSGTVRTSPGLSFVQILIGPTFIVSNFLLLFGVGLTRQSGKMTEGIVLLVLAPGFLYITYQNWGNDSQWLFVFAVALLALRPTRLTQNPMGWDLRVALTTVAALALALIAPSAYNIAISTVRHARLDPSEFSVLLRDPKHASLVVQTKLLYAPTATYDITIPVDEMAQLGVSSAGRQVRQLYGKDLPNCHLPKGLGGMMQYFARDLDAHDLAVGQSVVVADLLSNLWMFGNSTPIKNGAPWYYGGDIRFDQAAFLLVPFCPNVPSMWNIVLDQLETEGAPKYTEIYGSEFYTLYQRQK